MEQLKCSKIINFQKYDEAPAALVLFYDSRVNDQPQEVFPIWDSKIFKIGRELRSNTFAIETDQEYLVSRNHCEIYVVVYEHSTNHIYVRDRKSFNGTWVNGQLIGVGPDISSGYLLEDGDVIQIRPYWRLVLRQTWRPPEYPLTSLQKEECKIFAERYILTERCIGRGSEGAIYLAFQANTRKQLVCKVVNLSHTLGKRSYEQKRRKLQEADVLRQLHHPNVLAYIDAICSPETLYTFTELASGGDLLSFVLRQDQVSELDARIILRQVARGLQYLHSRGLVHRDLKLENILLAYSPKIAYHRVMLSDFGTCAIPYRSRMRTYVGTENYQAPEIHKSAQFQTSAVDIWSLGVVALHMLLSGNQAVENLDSRSQQDLNESIDNFLLSVSPSVSSDGRKFVSRCLQRLPSDRMSAIEAKCHDWFCKPKKHFEFFQKLDQKILKTWPLKVDIKPMPLELPSGNKALTSDGLQLHQEKPEDMLYTFTAGNTDIETFKEPPHPLRSAEACRDAQPKGRKHKAT